MSERLFDKSCDGVAPVLGFSKVNIPMGGTGRPDQHVVSYSF